MGIWKEYHRAILKAVGNGIVVLQRNNNLGILGFWVVTVKGIGEGSLYLTGPTTASQILPVLFIHQDEETVSSNSC